MSIVLIEIEFFFLLFGNQNHVCADLAPEVPIYEMFTVTTRNI